MHKDNGIESKLYLPPKSTTTPPNQVFNRSRSRLLGTTLSHRDEGLQLTERLRIGYANRHKKGGALSHFPWV